MKIAHREQVEITMELDEISEYEPELAEAVQENGRRYTNLFADVIYDLLPDYKEKEVCYCLN